LSTGLAVFQPGAVLPYHLHRFSEAITILQGEAIVEAEGRRYRVAANDCVHMPCATPHRVLNVATHRQLVAHWTFASSVPSREFVESAFPTNDRDWGAADASDPEFVGRFGEASPYEPAPGVQFRDLFPPQSGAIGICGGYGRLQSCASLPYQACEHDGSITIVEGKAVCWVQDKRYSLIEWETAFVPAGLRHRFVNESDPPLTMLWVYAGGEPDRVQKAT
jgi:mannose-6-phosphate isomerase-like protein (cupin superfamily)